MNLRSFSLSIKNSNNYKYDYDNVYKNYVHKKI